MLFLTGNVVGQGNAQNSTQASLLNVLGGNQASAQGAANNATVGNANVAAGNIVFNIF